MVASWSFSCLPVGALMKTPNLETLQTVLGGVEMWLTRDFHSRYATTKDYRREHVEYTAENFREVGLVLIGSDAFDSIIVHEFLKSTIYLYWGQLDIA